ncbi:TonB-dependent receptor [Catenovulum maritimum]|nr:TonB-dependent receptor [Catenovulum maritimum]
MKQNSLILTLSIFSVLNSHTALADSELEVIKVSAQKRYQDNQEVGISISTLSATKLERLSINDTVEITQQVPNLQLNAWSPNLTIFNLRGISQNNFTDNLESPVAVYTNDAYIGSLNAVSGLVFDLKQVEVLRGPQATLFGRNATGGVIHFVTNDATQGEFNGYVKSGAAKYNRHFIEAAAGGSISDSFRVRLALRKEKADGYIESNNPEIRAIGGTNSQAIRLSLQANLGDSLLIDFSHQHSQDNDIPTGGYSFLPWTQQDIDDGYLPPELVNFTQNVILEGAEPPNDLSLNAFTQVVFFNPDDGFTPIDEAGLTLYRGDHPQPHKHFSNVNGYLNRDLDNSVLKLSYELSDSLELVSISNFQQLEKSYLEDGDGIPAPIIAFQTDMDYQQLSQEIRLSGMNKTSRWQLGSYYLDMSQNGLITTVGNPVLRLANSLKVAGLIPNSYDPSQGSPQAIQDYQLESKNWSLFGQYEVQVKDNLTLIAGARWSHDDKSLEYTRGFKDDTAKIDYIEQTNINDAPAAAADIDAGDYGLRLQLNWQYDENIMYFTSYNRGIKGGNWAFSANVPVEDMQHEAETLHAYEVGIKSIFANQLKFNSTLFYYDYRDYQAFSMASLSPQIDNTDAWAKGAEIEITWAASEQFNLNLGATYMDSEVDEISAVGEWLSPVGNTLIDFPQDSIRNTKLPNTPKYSINYLLDYTWQLSSSSLIAQLDGVYYDEQFLEVTNGGGSYQAAYGVTNASLSMMSLDKSLLLSLWIKNLNNTVYKQYNLDLGMLGSTAYYAPPKTYGISVRFSW